MPAIKNKRVNLTDERVRQAKPPASGRRFIYDDKNRGLVLVIMPNGSKRFILYRRVHGKPTRLLLGKYPTMSVKDARDKATKYTDEINDGNDPQARRRSARRGITLG